MNVRPDIFILRSGINGDRRDSNSTIIARDSPLGSKAEFWSGNPDRQEKEGFEIRIRKRLQVRVRG